MFESGVLNTLYKKEAIKAAEELRYGKKVIERLEEAKSEHEVTRILTDARMGVIK